MTRSTNFSPQPGSTMSFGTISSNLGMAAKSTGAGVNITSNPAAAFGAAKPGAAGKSNNLA